MCYGVLFLGHRPAPIMDALEREPQRVTHFGCPHPEEIGFGEKFVECVLGADMVVLCNSGNEAIHKSVSIVRAFTGKTDERRIAYSL